MLYLGDIPVLCLGGNAQEGINVRALTPLGPNALTSSAPLRVCPIYLLEWCPTQATNWYLLHLAVVAMLPVPNGPTRHTHMLTSLMDTDRMLILRCAELEWRFTEGRTSRQNLTCPRVADYSVAAIADLLCQLLDAPQ
jgi:hypothetical protein